MGFHNCHKLNFLRGKLTPKNDCKEASLSFCGKKFKLLFPLSTSVAFKRAVYCYSCFSQIACFFIKLADWWHFFCVKAGLVILWIFPYWQSLDCFTKISRKIKWFDAVGEMLQANIIRASLFFLRQQMSPSGFEIECLSGGTKMVANTTSVQQLMASPSYSPSANPVLFPTSVFPFARLYLISSCPQLIKFIRREKKLQ